MKRSTITFNDLKDSLDQVVNELNMAAHIDDVYWQIIAIIQTNPELNGGGVFQEWLVYTYVDSIIIRLRRLTDKGKKTISLWRLLEDWKRSIANIKPKLATRAELNAKQKELTDAIVRVETYANTHIAHRAKNPPIPELKYEEVRMALVSVFKVFKWSWGKINSSMYVGPVPAIQDNWLAVFRIPWLKDWSIPTYKHLHSLL